MDCGYILYWVLFVCVLFGIVVIVIGMLFCNFCGPHCCCTAFCLAALFSLSSLVWGFFCLVVDFLFFGEMEEWFQTFSYQKWRSGFQIYSQVLWVILPLLNDWLWCFHCKGLLLSCLMILFFLQPLLSNFFSNCDASICPWLPLRCNHFDNIAQHFSFFSTGLED